MKKLLFITFALCFFMISCASTNTQSENNNPPVSSFNFNIPVGTEFELTDGITAKITSYKPVNYSIYYKGATYTPSGQGNVAFRATIKVTNNTNKVLKNIPYNTLELVTADDKAEFKFTNYTKPYAQNGATPSIIDLFSGKDKDEISAGSSATEDIYFVYPKVNTPVAITNNRIPVLTLYNKKTKNAQQIDINLLKYPHITECFNMTKSSTAEEIEAFMEKYGITYQDKDKNGLTIIVYSIINKNNSFFDKALEKSDLTIELNAGFGFDTVNLLGIAALQQNKYAYDKLIEKGFSISGKNNPAIIAVRNNDLKALRFIVEVLNVNISDLKIPMAMSPAKDAEAYCRDRKYTEMADYIASKK